ncbi:hypothetical protein PF005_g25401 [Phytophthora fragariae]|uniref:Uncharacterized protein n=1 Tax=Phytophthora fragariae TaxID=53985 RepID=A0A6A3DTR2_9STRA|nr:hypothetical protein PF009_g25991 [Phytophthora fragariae]KAE9175444.1 hypothetical protein PF005_g25401 [Phytophthora fragariae]
MLTKFSRVKVLKIYNSTVMHWSESAALSQKHHPNLMMLYLVRVNMTNGELPAGLLSDDFPQKLLDIEFCSTNLCTLPDDFDLKWPQLPSQTVDCSPQVGATHFSLDKSDAMDELGSANQ